MTDPTSTNVLLAEPTRGSDSGTWDVPMNLNASAIDGMLGGQTTISLSAATTFALSAPATGVVSPAAGPNQSWNAVVKLTGTLLSSCGITLSLPKLYIFDTTGLTLGTSFVQIQPASGTGTRIGLPPGKKTQLWYDGTNVDFVNTADVGSYMDLAAAPPACSSRATTVQPSAAMGLRLSGFPTAAVASAPCSTRAAGASRSSPATYWGALAVISFSRRIRTPSPILGTSIRLGIQDQIRLGTE